ncbi:MAG: hypothetical protein AAFV43_09675 [Planctomycetota bacterium]
MSVLSAPSHAGLVNPSFDTWSQPDLPDSWERVSEAPLTEVPGFGGVGSAMQLDPGGTANNASVNQQVDSTLGAPFSVSFEFIQAAGSGRGLNFEVRQPDTLGLIVLRVQDDGGSVNDIDLFDGPPGVGAGWTTIGDKAVVDGTRYRLTINGDLWEAGALGSYDLLLEDLDNAQTVVNATGLQNFFQPSGQAVTALTEIGGIQFNTGRSNSSYTVDNAFFFSVPEPGALITLAIASSGLLCVRRRTA